MSYYAQNEQLLSPSKIKAYIKSPNYFHRLYITGEIEKETTLPMIIGSAVDCCLTEGKEEFKKRYVVVDRRNLKNPTTDRIELNKTQYKEVVDLCESVERVTAYKDLADYKKQEIISIPYNLGEYFNTLCGRPDFYKIVDDVCIIVDLKTAQSIEGNKHHYDCLNYNYYFSQACYQLILKHLHPEIKRFISRHIVVGKEEYIYPVKTFLLNQERIEKEKIRLIQILDEIKNRKDWSMEDAKWEDEISIGELNEYEENY